MGPTRPWMGDWNYTANAGVRKSPRGARRQEPGGLGWGWDFVRLACPLEDCAQCTVVRRLLDRFVGPERLRHRADRRFLAGDFEGARAEYERARAVLSAEDFRRAALDSLIGSCERLAGTAGSLKVAGESRAISRDGGGAAVETPEDDFVPGLDDLFELAIADKTPSRARSYRALGRSFRAGYIALIQGTAERAVRLLQEAEAETSSSFVVRLELGRALSMAGRFAEARETLRRVERTKTDDFEGVVLLAAVNIELRRFDEARQKLEELVVRGEGNMERAPELVFLLGKSLAGLHRDEEALEKFKETVRLEPRFHEAFYEAGRLRSRDGDFEAAFELLNRAAALAPDEVSYNREVAEIVLAHDLDVDAGLAACDRLMITDEENRWQFLSWIAELYLRRGWRREAKDPLEKALHLVPPEKKAERLAIEQRLSTL